MWSGNWLSSGVLKKNLAIIIVIVMYMLLMHQRKRVHMRTKALKIPKVLMGHAHIISCDLSCMGAWDVQLPPVVYTCTSSGYQAAFLLPHDPGNYINYIPQ